jgi:hypothetical protein
MATFNYKCPKCDEEFMHTPNQDPPGHCGHDCQYCQTIMRWDDPNLIGQPKKCSYSKLTDQDALLPIKA